MRIIGVKITKRIGMNNESGKKNDEEKLRYDLNPVDFWQSLAKVLTYGAAKYGDRNWEKGMQYSRVYAAALHHLFAWARGEEIDEESGLPHIDCAATNLVFLSVYAKRGIGIDDRHKIEDKT